MSQVRRTKMRGELCVFVSHDAAVTAGRAAKRTHFRAAKSHSAVRRQRVDAARASPATRPVDVLCNGRFNLNLQPLTISRASIFPDKSTRGFGLFGAFRAIRKVQHSAPIAQHRASVRETRLHIRDPRALIGQERFSRRSIRACPASSASKTCCSTTATSRTPCRSSGCPSAPQPARTSLFCPSQASVHRFSRLFNRCSIGFASGRATVARILRL